LKRGFFFFRQPSLLELTKKRKSTGKAEGLKGIFDEGYLHAQISEEATRLR